MSTNNTQTDIGNQGNGNHENVNQNGNQENGNQGNGNQENGNQGNGNQENGNQGNGNQENGNQGNCNQENGNQENGNQGNGNQGNGNQGNGNQGNGNQGNGNQQTVVNEIITDPNFVVTNVQNITSHGDVQTNTTFTTTNNSLDVNVSEDLEQKVDIYDDESDQATVSILSTIREYASQIKCEDFHGKGTIDDYKSLFEAASKIATESSQINLDVNMDGFNEFGQAADDLAALFSSFITRLENVNIINDISFLQSVSSALQKIVHLSNVFGKFKETIIATSTIRLPKSLVDTRNIISEVMDEVNCAMNYMNYFVAPDVALQDAALSANDQTIITNAVATIDHWNVLCDQGVNITMANDENIKAIATYNTDLQSKTNRLKNITSSLQAKLASFTLKK